MANRFLYLTHDWPTSRYEHSITAAFTATGRFDVATVSFEPRELASDLAAVATRFEGYDAVVTFIQLRLLMDLPAIDWGGFSGARVMYDADAAHSYSTFATDLYLGRYPEVFRRHRFDAFVSTGSRTAELLAADGVDAHWLPKAYDSEHFTADFDHERRPVAVQFGSPYPARRAVNSMLQRSNLPVELLPETPFARLGETLNQYAAAVVCNLDAERRWARLPWRVAFLAPGSLVRLKPGLEPMAKNFEAAAAGCAVFMDHMPELETLGFTDGVNCVFYRSAEHLMELLAGFDFDRAEDIGRRGAALCAERHTWTHRGAEMVALVDRVVG